MENRIASKQRETFLRKQLEILKKELNESSGNEESDAGDEVNEAAELSRRIAEANLPHDVNKIAQRERRRLAKMQSSFAEYQIIRTYIEWLLELPWNKTTIDHLDIHRVRKQVIL